MYFPKEHDPHTSTLIVEPVGGNCNLSCAYCYHSNIRTKKLPVMASEILEIVIREGLKINPVRVKFLWHGGEPMLAGLDFYKQVVQFQNRFRTSPAQRISNHLQTNATLINEEWATFFKSNSFKLSTSIDGPKQLHDQCRFDLAGNGSFSRVAQGIKLLNRFGLNVGVVSTINIFNVAFPDLVYKSILDLGINSFEFNIASNTAGAPSLAPTPKDAAEFLKKAFNLWFSADDNTIHIRIFHNAIRSLIGLAAQDCSFSYNRCREYVACDESGNLYSCGRFLKETVAYIGSLNSESLLSLLKKKENQELYDRIAKIQVDCNACRWLGACGGGCAYQRWLNGGFGSSFPQCEIRKDLFEHIEECVRAYLPS